MAKTFAYAVKYNGQYYLPNTPIDEKVAEDEKVVEKVEKSTNEKPKKVKKDV